MTTEISASEVPYQQLPDESHQAALFPNADPLSEEELRWLASAGELDSKLTVAIAKIAHPEVQRGLMTAYATAATPKAKTALLDEHLATPTAHANKLITLLARQNNEEQQTFITTYFTVQGYALKDQCVDAYLDDSPLMPRKHRDGETDHARIDRDERRIKQQHHGIIDKWKELHWGYKLAAALVISLVGLPTVLAPSLLPVIFKTLVISAPVKMVLWIAGSLIMGIAALWHLVQTALQEPKDGSEPIVRNVFGAKYTHLQTRYKVATAVVFSVGLLLMVSYAILPLLSEDAINALGATAALAHLPLIMTMGVLFAGISTLLHIAHIAIQDIHPKKNGDTVSTSIRLGRKWRDLAVGWKIAAGFVITLSVLTILAVAFLPSYDLLRGFLINSLVNLGDVGGIGTNGLIITGASLLILLVTVLHLAHIDGRSAEPKPAANNENGDQLLVDPTADDSSAGPDPRDRKSPSHSQGNSPIQGMSRTSSSVGTEADDIKMQPVVPSAADPGSINDSQAQRRAGRPAPPPRRLTLPAALPAASSEEAATPPSTPAGSLTAAIAAAAVRRNGGASDTKTAASSAQLEAPADEDGADKAGRAQQLTEAQRRLRAGRTPAAVTGSQARLLGNTPTAVAVAAAASTSSHDTSQAPFEAPFDAPPMG